MIDEREAVCLERAFALAEHGGRATAPNPRVGAAVVQQGEVIGEGWHRQLGQPHAETQALEAAGERAAGSTLYVSLEPCAHTGRTPPCTGAILAAGVRRVVLGMIDPDERVAGRGVAVLRDAGVDVEIASGALAERAEQVLEDYLVHRRHRRAFALLKVASTLDGRIADHCGTSQWITGDLSRSHGRALRDRFGGILVGVGTVLADDPQLLPPTGEPGGVFFRCVMDRALRTPPDARLFEHLDWSPLLIFTAPDAPQPQRRQLEDRGAQVISLGDEPGQAPPRLALEDLAGRGVLGVVVEGGSRIHGAFLQQGLADKLLWYLAPRLLADPGALAAVDAGPRRLPQALDGRIARTERLGEDLLMTIYPRAGEGPGSREGSGESCSPAS